MANSISVSVVCSGNTYCVYIYMYRLLCGQWAGCSGSLAVGRSVNSVRIVCSVSHIPALQMYIVVTISTDNKETIEAEEDSSAEWKTRQVCRLGKK